MIVLTFDTDWCPEFVLEPVFATLKKHNLKGTIFCTNPISFKEDENIEFGIHPNFMPDSTQGKTEDEVLFYLKEAFPDAVSSRSHRLYWHSGLGKKLLNAKIQHDVSLCLPFQSHLKVFDSHGLYRCPYWYSDNLHVKDGLAFDKVDLPHFDKPGLKIFGFHPIHIYCNLNDTKKYQTSMKEISNLQSCDKQELAKHRQSGKGIGTFFQTLCEFLSQQKIQTYCIRDLKL